MIMNLFLLTGNQDKVRAAQYVFDAYGITVSLLKPQESEIQAATSLEIATYAAIKAAQQSWCVVLREDHALYFEGFLWGVFPGPYTSYFDKRVSAEEFVRCLYASHDDSSLVTWYFELGACVAFPDGRTITSTHRVPIEVSREPRGERWNLDKILMIAWSGKTFAECALGENTHHWTHNYTALAEQLSWRPPL